MRCPRRAVVTVCLGAAACLCTAPSAVPVVAQPPARAASGDPCLRYLPDDYWLVAGLDFSVIAPLLTGPQAQANPQYAEFMRTMRVLQAMTGVDPLRDIDRTVCFATGPCGPDATWSFAVQGSFDNGLVRRSLLTSGEVTQLEHRTHTILRLPSAQSLCFPEEATILVGNEQWIRQVIDRLGAPAPAMPAALRSVLDRTPADSAGWVAVRPEAVLAMDGLAGWRRENQELADSLGRLTCASLVCTLGDEGLAANVVGYAGAQGEADAVRTHLQRQKARLLGDSGSNVFLAAFLVLSDVSSAGPFVEASLRLTESSLRELWEQKFVVKPQDR